MKSCHFSLDQNNLELFSVRCSLKVPLLSLLHFNKLPNMNMAALFGIKLIISASILLYLESHVWG